MLYLALAVMTSVTVANLLKMSEGAGRTRLAVALVNYCVASVFMFTLWILDGAIPVSGMTILYGVYAGITWVVSLILIMYAIKLIGVAISSAVMRTGVALPVVLSVVIWSEKPGRLQILGIALAAIAVVLLSLKIVRVEKKFHWRYALVMALVWLSSGAAQLASKLFAEECHEVEREGYLVILFLVASGFTWLWLRGTQRSVCRKDLSYGIAVGVPNALTGFFLVTALGLVEGIIVYPVSAAAGVLLTALLGVIIWHEKLGLKGAIGIAIAVLSLVLVNLK
jgi:drug/metabolite transporter (DMT)-like permease